MVLFFPSLDMLQSERVRYGKQLRWVGPNWCKFKTLLAYRQSRKQTAKTDTISMEHMGSALTNKPIRVVACLTQATPLHSFSFHFSAFFGNFYCLRTQTRKEKKNNKSNDSRWCHSINKHRQFYPAPNFIVTQLYRLDDEREEIPINFYHFYDSRISIIWRTFFIKDIVFVFVMLFVEVTSSFSFET